MDMKKNLIDEYRKLTGTELSKDTDPKTLADTLNANPSLRELFRDAVKESSSDVGTGMNALFSGF